MDGEAKRRISEQGTGKRGSQIQQAINKAIVNGMMNDKKIGDKILNNTKARGCRSAIMQMDEEQTRRILKAQEDQLLADQARSWTQAAVKKAMDGEKERR